MLSFSAAPAAHHRSHVHFSGHRQLKPKEIEAYTKPFEIADRILPENTAKDISSKRFAAEYSTIVGLPSAIYKALKGADISSALVNKFRQSADDFLQRRYARQADPHWKPEQIKEIEAKETIVGLIKTSFTEKKDAKTAAEEINAVDPTFIPYKIAVHGHDSYKMLTFLTNSPDKAAELREKANNPFSNPGELTDLLNASSASSSEEALPLAEPSRSAPPPVPSRETKPKFPEALPVAPPPRSHKKPAPPIPSRNKKPRLPEPLDQETMQASTSQSSSKPDVKKIAPPVPSREKKPANNPFDD